MVTYLAGRLAAAVAVVLLVLVFLSLLVTLIPGDPVTLILGPRASPERVEEVRQQMGLDQSVPAQVWTFASGSLQGDIGSDFVSHTPVTTLVGQVLPHTLALAVAALIITVLVGVPLGVYAGTHRGTLIDRLLTALSIAFVTMPPYVAGLLLLLAFSISLRLFPSVGSDTLANPVSYLSHLVLPAVALALAWIGYVARVLRSSMIEVLDAEHVRAAEAFGVSRWLVSYKYALRIAIVPTVAVLGVGLGTLIGGAIFVEVIFSRPGLGTLIYDAVQSRNFPVLRGGVLVLVVLCIAANLVADLINRALDPRTRIREVTTG